MARSWGSLRAIIQSLLKALPAMTSLTIMLALYMFIAAVAGMREDRPAVRRTRGALGCAAFREGI